MTSLDALVFDDRGLLPAVIQDECSGRILMLGWMNRESLELTLTSGYVHFFSRSRQKLWKKGETSGNTLRTVDVRTDCDRDAVTVLARADGPTCHTKEPSCFFRPLPPYGDGDGTPAPHGHILHRLEAVIDERKRREPTQSSYVRDLLEAEPQAVCGKIREEQKELTDELLGPGTDAAVVHEAADLLFHVMVALAKRDITVDEVLAELQRRFGVSGHTEKASRAK